MTGQKVFPNYKKQRRFKIQCKNSKKTSIFLQKPGGGVKTTAGSETSRVSGNYHERKDPVVMVMASKSAMFLGTLVSAEPLLQ